MEKKEDMEKIYYQNGINYFDFRPNNYMNTVFKGKTYDDINSNKCRMFGFPIRYGSKIKAGDIVLIDEYCEAFPFKDIGKVDLPDSCEIVGIAISTFYTGDEKQLESVLVNSINILLLHKEIETDFEITEKDVCGPCYIKPDGTVTKDGSYTFAGQITGLENEQVYVSINLE